MPGLAMPETGPNPKGGIMQQTAKRAIILIIMSVLIITPFGTAISQENTDQEVFTEEKDTTAGFMTLDLLLVRPCGLAATVLGTAVFVVALPFTAISGDTKKSYEKLMKEPAKYTFDRPLGFF